MITAARPRIRFVVAAVVVVATLTACDPVVGTTSGPVRHATLTSPSKMTYRYAGNRSVVYAQPGSPADTNVREVFWYPDSAYVADQQVCTTWNTVAVAGSAGLLQPGVALRIAPVTDDGKGVKAVTITQNTFFGAIWLFNVHVWNSLDVNRPFTQIAQFDLSAIVGSIGGAGMVAARMVPAPWHVCARATGASVAFMVWTGTRPRPSWSDPTQVFRVGLPAGWNAPGYAGGYIGHLHPYQAAAFTGVTTEPVS